MRDYSGWITVNGRSLFSRVALPDDGLLRGAVLVATSFGREAVPLVGLWRRMAENLAILGVATVRVDYSATGDSSGNLCEPDDVRCWVDDISEITRWIRSSGAPRVAAVGMRLGTVVLGEALRAGAEFDQVVFWDPVPSGRHWIRENRALGMLHEDSRDAGNPGGVNDEFPFPEALSPVVSAWKTWRHDDEWAPSLVLRRVERELSDEVERHWKSRGATVEIAHGQAELLEVDTLELKWPEESMARVVAHLTPATSDALPWTWSSFHATVDVREATKVVVESIHHVGEEGLFLIESRSEDDQGAFSGTVIFVTDGYHNHWGPARSWVRLSRILATEGIRCLRFDFSHMIVNGEPSTDGLRIYVPEWRSNLGDIVNDLHLDRSSVIYVTFCSGAFEGVLSALDHGAAALLAINPPVGLDSFPFVVSLVASRRSPVRWVGYRARRLMLSARWPWVWLWMVGKWFIPPSHRRNQLRTLSERGVNVRVISCDEDRTPLYRHVRWRRFGTRRVDHPKGYVVRVVEGLDHSMRRVDARREVLEDVESFVRNVAASWRENGTEESVR